MLRFKSFLTEAKDSKAGAAANTNGVRHELMSLGVMNHMARHHGAIKRKSGKEYPNLLKMNHDELRHFYDNHVATGNFNEEMPEHFRDKDGQRPHQVFHQHNHKIEHDELFNHFKNSVEHVDKLHHHLREQGLNPETLHNISWTSKDGDVNEFMKKHGDNKNRQQNKDGDDFDGMASIKDKDGNIKHVGISMKWGSKKGAKPTLKNNTHNTVFGKQNRGELSPEYQDIADKFHNDSSKHIDNFVDKVKNHYSHESDAARGKEYREHEDAENAKPGSSHPSIHKKLHAVEQANLERNSNVANELHGALSEINNREKQKSSTKEISNYIRRKASVSSPDVVPVRAAMTINPKTNQADSHHFEDHSTHLNNILDNTHHFNISKGGGTVHIDAHDKDGKHLYRFSQWSKAGSRKIDKTTKVLVKQEGPKPALHEKPTGEVSAPKKASTKKTTTPKKDLQVNSTQNNPHWNEKAIGEMLDQVMGNNLVESTDTFKSTLSNKIAAKLLEAKKGLYSERFDKNLDKNHNGKLDADDFKKLRASKKQNKCTATCEETVEEGIGSMLGLSTTKGKPDWKKAPKWATHLGRTHEGAFHWLDKNTELTNKSSDSYYPNAGKIKFSGHVDTKKGIGYVEQKPTNEETIKQMEDALNEVLNPSMGVKAYIDDFIKSDDSRFTGDSKEKRRQRAIAAFYNDKK